MARPLREELAGGLYHVTSRGDRREAIYIDDEVREKWLEILGNVCSRFNWRCHAYCLMDNHYHIVIKTAVIFGVRVNVSKLREISIIVGCAVRTKIPASKNFHGAHGAPYTGKHS